MMAGEFVTIGRLARFWFSWTGKRTRTFTLLKSGLLVSRVEGQPGVGFRIRIGPEESPGRISTLRSLIEPYTGRNAPPSETSTRGSKFVPVRSISTPGLPPVGLKFSSTGMAQNVGRDGLVSV